MFFMDPGCHTFLFRQSSPIYSTLIKQFQNYHTFKELIFQQNQFVVIIMQSKGFQHHCQAQKRNNCRWAASKAHIIISTDFAMYNRLSELSNYDAYSYSQDFNHPELYSLSLDKGPLRQTNAGPEENIIEEQPFYYRSQQICKDNYEISFENNFMDEHKTVIQTELSKLFEFKTLNIDKQGKQKTKSVKIKQRNWNLVASEEKGGLTCQQIAQLQKEEKIDQFLNIVCSNSTLEVGTALIKIAYEVLLQFNKVRKADPSTCQLLQLAEQLSNNLNYNQLQTYIFETSSSTPNREWLSQCSHFMNIYCSTVMLVLALYFQNPFSKTKADGPKRPLVVPELSDLSEDQIFELAPQKKRKFSF